MAGPPQREPDSVPGAGRSVADSTGDDVIEGGGPPARLFSRKVVVGMQLACVLAVVVWLCLTVAGYVSKSESNGTTLTVHGVPVPSFGPESAVFEVNLTNDSDAPIVIDNVAVVNDGSAADGNDPWAPAWVEARVRPPNTPSITPNDDAMDSVLLEGNGGLGVLTVTVNPPCNRQLELAPAQLVIGWHTELGKLDQILVPGLLQEGPTNLDDLVSKFCDAQQEATEGLGPAGGLPPGDGFSWPVKDVQVSFQLPARGWERFGHVSINKSSVPPQGAEAMMFWTDLVGARAVEVCGQWWGSPEGTMADFAEQASTARGTELVSGPSAVTVGGRPAQHLVLRVQKPAGCDPGFFYTWVPVNGGAFWTQIDVGDTVQLWLVDVGGRLLYIEGDTHRNAGSSIRNEMQQIVDSMRFD